MYVRVYSVQLPRVFSERPKYPELWDNHRRRRCRFSRLSPERVFPGGRFQSPKCEKGLLNTLVGRDTWATQTLCPPRGGCENSMRKTAVNRRLNIHQARKAQKGIKHLRLGPKSLSVGSRCSESYGSGGARLTYIPKSGLIYWTREVRWIWTLSQL